MIIYLVPALILAFVAYLLWRRYRRNSLRKELMQMPLHSDEWDLVLEAVPLIARLPETFRPALAGRINLFLDQVEFLGCNGLKVTDRMMFAIAAQASLLVVNKTSWYDTLETVLIYPNAFKSQTQQVDGYVVTEKEVIRSGESWARGPVILSWAHSERGAFIDDDGHNVVLHEFAHQLDNLSGYTDGSPITNYGKDLSDWDAVMSEAFTRLRKNLSLGKRGLIDPYGATHMEEFFAVLVELFFEKAKELKIEEPKAYGQLVQFFNLDPSTW